MLNKGEVIILKKYINEERIIVMFLTVVALVFIIMCLQARTFVSVRVPFFIAVPTFIGLLWQLSKLLFPSVRSWSLYNRNKKKKKEDFQIDADVIEETSIERKRRMIFSLWLILIVAIIYYFGFLYAISIGLLFYFRALANFSWLKSIYFTAGYFGFIYLFFVVFLKMDLL